MIRSSYEKKQTRVNFILMARFAEPIPINVLRDALNRLKGRQHAFDLRSSRDITLQHQPETGPYPLQVIKNGSTEDWKTISASELELTFDSCGPLARFILIEHIQGVDLLIVCDHSVSDGLSGVFLLRDLCLLLSHPNQKLDPLPIPPPLWEILPRSAHSNIPMKIRMAINLAIVDFFNWYKKRQRTHRQDHHFRINSAELSIATTNTLIERCQIEHTSVHAAICSAWLLALDTQMQYQESDVTLQAKKPKTIRKISSPVNLRKLLAPEMRECAGMYYTTVETSVECRHSRGFWNIAREIKQNLNQADQNMAFFTTPLFLYAMFKRQARLPENEPFEMPEIPVMYDYSITNLGRLNTIFQESTQNDSPFQITELYGPMVNAFSGEKTVGISTLNRQIRFVFTTFVNEISSEKADAIISQAIQELQEALSHK